LAVLRLRKAMIASRCGNSTRWQLDTLATRHAGNSTRWQLDTLATRHAGNSTRRQLDTAATGQGGNAEQGATVETKPELASSPARRPELTRITSRMFAVNTYIFHWPERTDCVVIDPGFDADRILQRLFDSRLTPVAILNTQGHIDHISGNAAPER